MTQELFEKLQRLFQLLDVDAPARLLKPRNLLVAATDANASQALASDVVELEELLQDIPMILVRAESDQPRKRENRGLQKICGICHSRFYGEACKQGHASR